MSIADNFEKLLASGKDGALLRFSLGNEYLKTGDTARAVAHLQAAVAQDAGYSAAWKLLGKALMQSDDRAGAMLAYEKGIAAATAKGDKQAAKEMTVFLRRLTKEVDQKL
jgi:predicted Zn-dependent protease